MDLKLNTKLFSSKGFLGRKDFFLNILIITIITMPFWQAASFFEPDMTKDTSHVALCAALLILEFVLMIPSIIKRINDIKGSENNKFNYLCLLVFVTGSFIGLFIGLTPLIIIACYLYLQIKAGKLSSKLPYDILNDFNWGAFFGTWIWGLINKSYKTLWAIILWITPVGFFFNLVCGLKGNKWAAKNRDWKSIEEFKKSQEKQTIFFVIFNIIIIPILSIILLIGTVAYLVQLEKQKPGSVDKFKIKCEKIIDVVTNSEFDSNEITEQENKYYINPKKWEHLSYSERRDLLKYATDITVFKKNNRTHQYKGRTSKETEILITKIYSSENGELLGEYVDIDREKLKTSDSLLRDAFKEVINAYKFYEPTK